VENIHNNACKPYFTPCTFDAELCCILRKSPLEIIFKIFSINCFETVIIYSGHLKQNTHSFDKNKTGKNTSIKQI
jgi:hypothetical protein